MYVATTNKSRMNGSALIGALAFTIATSMILAGVITLATSHYLRTNTEAAYAASYDAAEAGVNYEIRKISQSPSSADQAGSTGGYTSALADGTFRVYCSERSGGTWTPPDPLYITSTGTVEGVSRTIRVAAHGVGQAATGTFALFGTEDSDIGTLSGNPVVIGDVGTNGLLTFNGHPSVSGDVVFDGPGSNWTSGGTNPNYTVIYNPSALSWPTVESLAAGQFAGGGLTWLAINNDNSLAVPPITSTNVNLGGGSSLTLVGKAGGANYYLNSLTMTGNATLTFNNSAGPINVWFGPSGAPGGLTLTGAAATVKMSTDPSRAVRFYVATSNNIFLTGDSELDCGVYAMNEAGDDTIGFNGNATAYGQYIAPQFSVEGTPTVTYPGSMYSSNSPAFFGFDSAMAEQNGAWN
ncbi:MAG: hypothetical protein KGJ62_08525 [Armatimonadetes bacterium]|nr:hypothetical protein [Armatimonadota bacterium]MDE2205063.1 hypothetical protein [Armatimonadota bacterium]